MGSSLQLPGLLRAAPAPHLPEELAALARRVERDGAEVRLLADRLQRAAAGVRWESLAADSYEDRATAHAAGIRACAVLMDDAAREIRSHGQVVCERLESLRAEALRVAGLVVPG